MERIVCFNLIIKKRKKKMLDVLLKGDLEVMNFFFLSSIWEKT